MKHLQFTLQPVKERRHRALHHPGQYEGLDVGQHERHGVQHERDRQRTVQAAEVERALIDWRSDHPDVTVTTLRVAPMI